MGTVIFAIALLGGAFMFWRIIRTPTPQEEFSRGYRRFMRDARARGLSAEQTFDELEFRQALVKIRRIASDRALLNPLYADKVVAEVIEEEGKRLAHVMPKALHSSIMRTIRSLTIDQVLYEDAIKARRDALFAGLPKTPTLTREQAADMIAAFRTTR